MNGAYGRGRKNRKEPPGWTRICRIIPGGSPMRGKKNRQDSLGWRRFRRIPLNRKPINIGFLCNSERNLREKGVNL